MENFDSIKQELKKELKKTISNRKFNLPTINSQNKIISIPYIDTEHSEGIVSVKPKKKNIFLSTFSVSASISDTDISQKTLYNDISTVSKALIDEMDQTLDKNIFNTIKDLSVDTYLNVRLNFIDKIFRLFKKNHKRNVKFDLTGDIFMYINKISKQISRNTRLGYANFIIGNNSFVSKLQELKSFIHNNNDNIENRKNVIYPVGSVDNITVYCNPLLDWDTDYFYIGRVNDDISSGGLVYIFNDEVNVDIYTEYMGPMGPIKLVANCFSAVEFIGDNPGSYFKKVFYKEKK